MKLALSFVIPLYHSAETIGPLVKRIEALTIEGGHEIVLVNDGSRDGTAEVCRRLVAEAQVLRNRWYWRDARIAKVERTWRLAWQSLTRQYRIPIGEYA